MKPVNLSHLQEQARGLARAGLTDAEIVRRTGLTVHHVLTATRPGYAARKAKEMLVRHRAEKGQPPPNRVRRLASGGEARWRGRLPMPRHAHPLVRQLIMEMNARQMLVSEVAAEAGFRACTISEWRYRRIPKLDLLQAALNVLGLELVILPKRAGSEAELHPAATDILDAAYAVVRAHKAVILAEHTPAQGDARRKREKSLDALMHAVEAAHV
ncbi:hypothetical protein EJV44_04530 [Ancylobacter aquaticus]|nr:hypothetical protein EJV44_04530 [Ancylobacter aquaticus]